MPTRSSGARVLKTLAQKTITLADELGLSSKKLKIKRVKDFVYIPLARRPSKPELEQFLSQASEARVSTYSFQEKTKTAISLADVLEDKLSPRFIASLPHSLDIVGKIAVVEVPPELRPFKTILGDAILKLNKNVRTVLAKQGPVSGTYRLRGMEVIAGKPNTTTIHREHGCQYYVDLAKAYFSPRLSFEHHRVASQVRNGEIVLDMFAGVGPFAVQIAKALKSVRVYALDANPYAIEYLKKNIRLNRVNGKVIPILGNSEEVVQQRLLGMADRVIMNLPEQAAQFICAACHALKPRGGIIHFYGFLKAPDTLHKVEAGFVQDVEQCGRDVKRISHSRLVRATAPYEWQFVIDAWVSGVSPSE
jgi:tRNA (guanine37-N1)-methyltransferase